jgi:hypothetical protein
MQMRTRLAICLLLALVHAPIAGQTAPDIRALAAKNSRLMHTAQVLTDVYSPRLTGTPNLAAAQDWAKAELESYGWQNVHFENWDFGSPGWANERLSVHVVAPFKDSLVAEAVAWTPGTRGAITAPVFHLTPPPAPTLEELNAYLAGVTRSVRGKIVLTGKHAVPPVNFNPSPRRLSDDAARRIYAPAPPRPSPDPTPATTRLTAQEVNDEIDKFLKINGALARVYDAREAHGVIRAVVNRRREAVKLLPAIVLRNEDYGRVTRVLADGAAVKLELNIVNRLFPAGRTQRNLIAEIPGADKGDEIVMLGAHLDSHHLATGATDNAVGCAVMMEAARILQAAGAKPRRAIRLALWSGEEQRVLGSQEYVKKHFGSAENPQPAFGKLSAYFNLDTGTGRIRGMRVFGPPEAGEVLREMLAPLADLGVVGASVYSNRTAPGSDHAAFSVNGLPGVYIDQDPLEYGEFTWHTNLDTYERIVEEDARQAAIVIATVVWQTAMREEKLPRFAPDKMPPLNYFPAPAF